MTEFDLTDKEVEIISLCLNYCAAIMNLRKADQRFAEHCKKNNITADQMIKLDQRMSYQSENR